MKLLITGGPRTGKSTLTRRLSEQLTISATRSTDELLEDAGIMWTDAIVQIVRWMEQPGPWIIEGVKVPHAMLRFKELHPGAPPADRVIFLPRPLVPLTRDQSIMTKGIFTAWKKVRWMVEDTRYEHLEPAT